MKVCGEKAKEYPSVFKRPSGDFSNFGVKSQNLNFFKHVGSSRSTIGAGVTEVEEPLWVAKSVIFEFEVDEVAEPKALLPGELRKLILRYGSPSKASVEIGASEAFVRQNAKSNK